MGNYKFILYSHYDKPAPLYQHINYTIKASVYNAKSDNVIYSLDGAPANFSIDDTGVVSVNSKVNGEVTFAITATDTLLELSRSIPIKLFFNETSIINLPLHTDITSNVLGYTWTDNASAPIFINNMLYI